MNESETVEELLNKYSTKWDLYIKIALDIVVILLLLILVTFRYIPPNYTFTDDEGMAHVGINWKNFLILAGGFSIATVIINLLIYYIYKDE
ncbi:MAG: hypothetical protein ACOCRK_04045 [bacterium]